MTGFGGRVGLVVGAGSGIAAATAELLGQRGAAVVAADVDPAAAGATAARIAVGGGRATAVRYDVTRADGT